MEGKKVHSLNEVLFVNHYKHKTGELKSIAKTQISLAEAIFSFSSNYSSVRSLQAMLSQTLRGAGEVHGFRLMPKNLKEAIIRYTASFLSEEDFPCFEKDLNCAIESIRNEHSLKKASKGGHDHVLFDEEFTSATKNLLKHIELLGDNSSIFESVESKFSFKYKGVDIDISLKRRAREKSE